MRGDLPADIADLTRQIEIRNLRLSVRHAFEITCHLVSNTKEERVQVIANLSMQVSKGGSIRTLRPLSLGCFGDYAVWIDYIFLRCAFVEVVIAFGRFV